MIRRFGNASISSSGLRPLVRLRPGGRVGPDGMVGGLGPCPASLKIDRGRVVVHGANVAMLIGYAYRLSPDRINGPDFDHGFGSPAVRHQSDDSARFIAKSGSRNASDPSRRLLQTRRPSRGGEAGCSCAGCGEECAEVDCSRGRGRHTRLCRRRSLDRDSLPSIEAFAGEVHDQTTRNADGSGEITTLSIPRRGTVRWTATSNQRNWRLEAPGITLEGLAELLNGVVPLPSRMVDMTRLKGRYRMTLDVSLKDALVEKASMMERDDAVLRGFNIPLRKLGLQLERRKGPVEMLFVDQVEKIPSEN